MPKEMNYIAPQPNISDLPDVFETEQSAPSNIALVKYWGKHSVQLPMNPSISFTLNKSRSITKIRFEKHSEALKTPNDTVSFTFLFEGQARPAFEPKLQNYFNAILPYVSYLKHYTLHIDSRNTFPHSSGIASSASAFAALSKAIIELEKTLFPDKPMDYWLQKTSFLARLGSGSAARSAAHPVMIWGQHTDIKHTSDLYAIVPDVPIAPVFQNYQDTIVLVEKGQKKVSSTAGHGLMQTHPYKEIRKQQGFDHTKQMLDILQQGDIESFIELVEQEALTLHALMMTSSPNYILMQPETLRILHQIRAYRQETGVPVCFTLDAGANVHILYPQAYKTQVLSFIKKMTERDIIEDYT